MNTPSTIYTPSPTPVDIDRAITEYMAEQPQEIPHSQVDDMTFDQYMESNIQDTSGRFVTPEFLRNVDAGSPNNEESLEMDNPQVDTGHDTTEIEIKEEPGADNADKSQVDEGSEEDGPEVKEEAEGDGNEDSEVDEGAVTDTEARPQQLADYNWREDRQATGLNKKIHGNWKLAALGKTTSTFSSRGPDGVIGDNQRLIDIVDMQRNFVNTGNRKGGGIFKKVYKDGKKKGQAVISKKGHKSTCTVIDSAKAAFKPAMRLKNDKDVIEAGRKSALKILERYVDAQPRKKGKAKRESKKGKKAKVDEAEDEEHEDEDIDCVGIDKVLEKGPEDEDEGPEGNGGAAFDYSVSPFLIEEAVEGDGDVCGSALINMRFQAYVKSRMGPKPLERYIEKNPRAWAGCLKHFEERTKRDFDPERFPDKEYPIPLWHAADDPDADISDSHIVLSTVDLTEIFRPVIQSALLLVGNQYEALIEKGKRPRGLILVGGFSRSKHLFQSLKNNYAAIAPDFEVIRPPHAWSAVAIGAVIHRLEGAKTVKSRIARRHYGVLTRAYWKAGEYSEASKTWCADEGAWYADDVVKWYVTKGQSMLTGNPISMPFYVTGREISDSEIITMIVSDEDEPPKEFKPTDKTRILCTINAGLESVARRSWKVRYNDKNKKYLFLQHSIGLTFGPGGLSFDVRVGQKVVGTAKADYDQ
ncbi:hypothetical protein D6C81_02707 [Aureobasidium pullulans]|nr:hypothetical protein D6C81_02707 [Aureobasidium pullulans]